MLDKSRSRWREERVVLTDGHDDEDDGQREEHEEDDDRVFVCGCVMEKMMRQSTSPCLPLFPFDYQRLCCKFCVVSQFSVINDRQALRLPHDMRNRSSL